MNEKLVIYTDGGCKGNPGKGAWGVYIENAQVELNGGERDTTNNRMELQATIEALRWVLKSPYKLVEINTDSKYVQQGISEWINNWKKNKWLTANKKPVKNQDLWKILDELSEKIDIEWKWVEGHAGVDGNEKAHNLVSQYMDNL